MKTLRILFVLFLLLNITYTTAQLKVSNSGNVGIQLGTDQALSALSIGGIGNTESMVYINGIKTALMIQRIGGTPSAGASFHGIYSSTFLSGSSPTFNFGIKGQSSSDTYVPYARTYGVMGIAGNGHSGYNYGLFGQLKGSAYGAGIIGVVSNQTLPEIYISDRYAGYFAGDVYSTQLMKAVAFINYSDIRYKKDVENFDSDLLNKVFLLNPVKYSLKQQYYKTLNDSTDNKIPIYDEKSELFQRKHYGLIAQEVQEIYPDLVYKDGDGMLSVDYIGLIPILIESLKELNKQVEALTIANSESSTQFKIKSGGIGTNSIPGQDSDSAPSLEQNAPNPFSTETTLNYFLPASTQDASIFIYDMNGSQLKNYQLSERGYSQIVIQASELNAGMYLYALIADKQLIDSKRMILTK